MLTINFVGQVSEVNEDNKLQSGVIKTSARENEIVELDFTYYVGNGTKLELNKFYVVNAHLYVYENKYCISIKKVRETLDTVLAVDYAGLLAKVHGGKNDPTKYVEINNKRVLQIQMVNRTPVKENSNWINVLVYNDKVHQYLDKLQNGNSFSVEGLLMFGNYTKDNNQINTLSMMLNSFEFVSGGSTSNTDDKSTKMEYNNSKDNTSNETKSVDDIPF